MKVTWLWEGRWGLGAAALAGVIAAGCGDETASGRSFVGRVTTPGQDAVIGVVSNGTEVSFYVCGGPATYATATHWLTGAAGADGAVDVTGDGWHVTGNVTQGSGTLSTAKGEQLAWTVRPAMGAIEGLFEADDSSCRTGAVVGDFGDGQGLRLQGTWCDAEGRFAQVTPIKALDSLSVASQSLDVTVEPPGPSTLVLARLVAPLPPP
jgi:hypothetical protein